MEKNYIVVGQNVSSGVLLSGTLYNTRDKAEKAAKKLTLSPNYLTYDIGIYELVATTENPKVAAVKISKI